jgi:hypothetical protein
MLFYHFFSRPEHPCVVNTQILEKGLGIKHIKIKYTWNEKRSF